METARQTQLKAIAVTDHDDIRSIMPMALLGAEFGIEVVPGIEISTVQAESETHILGYYINAQHEELIHFTRQFRLHREQRAQQILYRLNTLGIHIPFEILKLKAGEGSLGRPHIADLLVEDGIVFSFQEAFHKYLGENRPCYVKKMKVTAQQAIDLIHDAGGMAFLAHPGTGVSTDIIYQLIDLGLDGIETIHPKHLPLTTEMYHELAVKNNLLETGGSDCHGGRRGEMMLGSMPVPYALLDNIKTRHTQLRMQQSA